jgi:transketolase
VGSSCALASYYHLDNLIAIVDVNRLGQSQATMYGHDLSRYESRFQANGWNTLTIDGHDFEQIHSALSQASAKPGSADRHHCPHVKRVRAYPCLENLDSWHGKPLKKGDELEKALAELGSPTLTWKSHWSLAVALSQTLVPESAHVLPCRRRRTTRPARRQLLGNHMGSLSRSWG